ncbi:MAG: hypothetical protein ACM3PA_01105 [Methanomassiliicoccales archaeon]
MDWLFSNLELLAELYTFLGQYKFYIAIAIEALPGIDPKLVDMQYNYRVAANLDYATAALLRLIRQYLININTLIIAAEAVDVTIENATKTTVSTQVTDPNTRVDSNKTSMVLKPLPSTGVTSIRIMRQGRSQRWQKNSNRKVIKVYPGEYTSIEIEGTV